MNPNSDAPDSAQTMFPPIGMDPIADPTPPADPAPEGDPVAELRAQLEAERAARQEAEQRHQARLDQLITTVAAPRQAPAEPAPLPDPLEKPKDYAAALEQRFEQRLQRETAAVQQQVTTERAVSNLWSDFRTRHADLSKNSDAIEFAASKVANEMRARGIDPLREAAVNPEAFNDKVAERVRSLGGQSAAPLQNRTSGVQGGSAPAPKGRPATNDQPRSFIDQIKDAQRKQGLI